MDKNAIKKYAVWARRELISRVSQKALQYGITEENFIPADAATVNGVVLSNEEKKQRRALIEKINDKGYQQVMEEVAYTWFNRFIALRFMEVNGYLPSHIRVFTDDENNFKPQILTEAINLDFDGLNMDKVYELKDANDNEALFKYLLIVQCNALSTIMPRMFQKISDYTELLFPDNLLREESVVQQMIELIPEEDWKDAVQIIGWLYQFYNIEPKADVFAKKSGKITKEEIPAATQLFTPDWIVRYMVENSLGRLWVEGHPNDELKAEWKYYLEEAEQEEEVQAKLVDIRKEYASITPEQIKCIDPCAGSGHILTYIFDVLIQIYEAYGYTAREAVHSIVENNIYGLDIDERAAQLAQFSVMMKARQYDRRFFTRKGENGEPDVPQPHIYTIVESNGIDKYTVDYFINGDSKLKVAINSIIKEMYDAKEYGSILDITSVDFESVYARFDEIYNDININREIVLNELLPLVSVAEVMSQKYEIVITNPPYLSITSAEPKLYNAVHKNYPDSKADLFSVFIERCHALTKPQGFHSMITMHAWMFLSSYEKLRQKIQQSIIVNMAHLGPRAFEEIGGEVVQTTTFVMQKAFVPKYKGTYARLVEPSTQDGKKEMFLSGENRFVTSQDLFNNIPGSPCAYWVSSAFIENFLHSNPVGDTRKGMVTADNPRFIRAWTEIDYTKIGFGCSSREEAKNSHRKWFPYVKGGEFRKWYGNLDWVVNWENDGAELLNMKNEGYKVGSTNHNLPYIFKPAVCWTKISSTFSARIVEKGFLLDDASPFISIPSDVNRAICLGLYNSPVCQSYLDLMNPTMNFSPGTIANIPYLDCGEKRESICEKVNECIELASRDWNSFETSWDFSRHPLLEMISKGGSWFERGNIDLAECYKLWEDECATRFKKMKINEEELNSIYIEIYGLNKELSREVDEKNVTIHLADKKRDIKSLLSYAVGCMFGRYSLDEEKIIFAGGEWDNSKYMTFKADKDSIIPICDDEYFEDDIVNRFVRFVEVVYGKPSLEDNLQFIAEALGGSGQPRDVIRKYFMNDFYTDHLRIYQKRPIYWMFDSGKKNGFKALVYMHRYQPDTIARMRTDYVHEQQSRYRTAIADLEQRIASAVTSERVKLNKRLKTLKDQAAEIQVYEEKIHHLADQYISIDLDDGIKANYAKFQDVLAKIK